jgi:hypothetical protein
LLIEFGGRRVIKTLFLDLRNGGWRWMALRR